MKTNPRSVALFFLLLLFPPTLAAEDDATATRAAQLEAAKKKLTSQAVLLRYRFAAGEVVRTKVVHLVTVETKIQGVTQTAKTRSVSTKSWKISSVDDQDQITFVHQVDNVDMWQHVSGRQEIRYNSQTDEKPPPVYEQVAESVGVPLATITITPSGRIAKREDARAQFNPGIGELTVPLPETAVKIGQTWSIPEELRVRLKDGRIKRVQTRQLYAFEKLETGVATIGMKTQVLTPIHDARVEAQLVQRLKNGTIKFDVDAGRLLSKQMDMDKSVIGFNGADSNMQYLARFTEESLPDEATTARKSPSSAKETPPASKTDVSPIDPDGKNTPAVRRR